MQIVRNMGFPSRMVNGVLNDPFALTIEDELVEGEQRFISLESPIGDPQTPRL